MADIEITGTEELSLAEVLGFAQELVPGVYTGAIAEEFCNITLAHTVAVNDDVTMAENVSQVKGTAMTTGKNVLLIGSVGAVDWLWTDALPGNRAGIRIYAITVMLAGADTIILREGSLTGPVWFKYVSTGAANEVIYFGGVLQRPVMVASEQTMDPGSKFAIVYEKP